MPHHEDRFLANDGLTLYRQCWTPDTAAEAVVILIHGFTEHSGRYADVAEVLGRHGYTVHAMDLRGHGRSEGERMFVNSFDEYLGDMDRLWEYVQGYEPGKPVFLLGHSMGGAIVARFAMTRQPEVNGLILSAPALGVGHGLFPVLRKLAPLASRWFPRLRVVRMGSDWLSRDPQVVADFRDDLLVFHDRFPVRIGAELLRMAGELQDQAPAMRLPFLILHGTGDRVVGFGTSQEFHDRAGSTDKAIRLYEGLYHDLLHEPEREQVLADLIGWLDDRR